MTKRPNQPQNLETCYTM